jgi:hypothetical protein
MTTALFVSDDNTAADSVPVTWEQPTWAAKVEANDGAVIYYGPWTVANPGRCADDQVSVRLSASDYVNLLPDGTAAASRTTTVEIRIGGERSMEGIVLELDDSTALSQILSTLNATARQDRRHD